MKYLRFRSFLITTISLSVLLVGGCGDGDGGPPLEQTTRVEKVIGPEGGTVEVTDPSSEIYGVKVEIPAGALAEETTIIIEETRYAPSLPTGLTSGNPIVNLSPNTPFIKDIEITFPIQNIPSSDEEILSAFHWDFDNGKWIIEPPKQINGNEMIVKTNHFSMWRWGIVLLDEVEPETITAAMEEMFYVDDWNELTTEVENKIAPFTSTFDEWIDYSNHWDHCTERQAVADILKQIIQVTEAGIIEYLETQSVIDACDPVYICELSNMLITDEQGRLMKWAEVEIRALFGEAFWGALPGFGGVAGDIIMDVIGKALMEAQYRHAVEYELGCDYRCILKNGDFDFFVNVLACNISYLALFGMEVYESHDPCIP